MWFNLKVNKFHQAKNKYNQPCAWWFCAEQVPPCQSFFGQHSWRTGPSSLCTGRCGARLSGSTLHLSAELSLHAKSGSHTSPQHYWGKIERNTFIRNKQIHIWAEGVTALVSRGGCSLFLHLKGSMFEFVSFYVHIVFVTHCNERPADWCFPICNSGWCIENLP